MINFNLPIDRRKSIVKNKWPEKRQQKKEQNFDRAKRAHTKTKHKIGHRRSICHDCNINFLKSLYYDVKMRVLEHCCIQSTKCTLERC